VLVEVVDQRTAEQRQDGLGKCQRDVEQPHVFCGLGLVGQGVAGEGPIDREVQPVPDSVGHPEREYQRNGLRIEGDEHDCDERLGRPRQVNEDLAASNPVGDLAAEESKRKRGHDHHQKPVVRELRRILFGTEDDVAEEVDEEVQNNRDSRRDHEAGEDNPREVAFVERPQELADRFCERALRWTLDAHEALCSRRPHGGDEGERSDGSHHEIDGAVVGEQARDPEAAPDPQLSHRGEEATGLADLLGRHNVGDDPGIGGSRGVEEELDDGVSDDDLRVVARRHQDEQAGNREERARDHDWATASPPRVEPVRPGSDDGRYRHREQAAEPERDADGRVL